MTNHASPIPKILLWIFITLASGLTAGFAGPPELRLPTDNTALFTGNQSGFYMYTDREFEGVRSKPWTGGKYGYTRNQKRTSSGIVFTRFHEGVDIRPVRRDSSGRALDEVRSIGAGKIVHVSNDSSRSSYGRYVVVRHDWGDGAFFSLYGHLQTIVVKVGQRVSPGTNLGQMGCTGWAGNRDIARSHVHLELNLMAHDRFKTWHDASYRSPNHHGIYNGLNLIGLDVAGLLNATRNDPSLTLPQFVGRMIPYFKVTVPKAGTDVDLITNYPWLTAGKSTRGGSSWELTLSRSGVPLAVAASDRVVSGPTITWVLPSKTLHSYHTRGRLTGSGSRAGLSDSGKRYIDLLTGRF